jgi:hypothetical protein
MLVDDTRIVTLMMNQRQHHVVDDDDNHNFRTLFESSTFKVQPVYIWTNDKPIYNEMKHFIVDGIEQSRFIKRIHNLTTTSDDDDNNMTIPWIVDTGTGKRPSKWCQAFTEAVASHYYNQTKTQPWDIHIFHYGDDPGMPDRYQHCDALYDLFGEDNNKHLYYYKRSMVRDRSWNETSQSVSLGHVDPLYTHNYSYWSHAPIRHVSYGVRSDTVAGIEAYLESTINISSYNHQLIDLPTILPRRFDVAHFWPAPTQQQQKVDRGRRDKPNSRLRDAVSTMILEWNATSNYTGFAGLAGSANLAGRNEAQQDYVQALLSYKIIVVAQKDTWEGHYRLMEALASGALVCTDRMLLLPEGLQDGVSIVIYDNVTDLKNKMEYYLQHDQERIRIAREGWRIAMTQHRSWHIMERVLFGRVMTND